MASSALTDWTVQIPCPSLPKTSASSPWRAVKRSQTLGGTADLLLLGRETCVIPACVSPGAPIRLPLKTPEPLLDQRRNHGLPRQPPGSCLRLRPFHPRIGRVQLAAGPSSSCPRDRLRLSPLQAV